MECSGHQISFQFQLGLIRDRVTMYSHELDLKSLKSKASDFICDKCPNHEITRLPERILLFRHDYQSSNILQVHFMSKNNGKLETNIPVCYIMTGPTVAKTLANLIRIVS